MKKSIIVSIFLVSVSLCVSIAYSLHASQPNKTSSLLLKNIEALATGEDGADDNKEDADKIRCTLRGSLDCPLNHTKVKYVINGYDL